MSFATGHLNPNLRGVFGPITGRDAFNKKSVDDHLKATEQNIKKLENHLLVNTYLVGERLTLADLYVFGNLHRGFEYIFDKQWRENHPNTTRWAETIQNQEIIKPALPKGVTYVEKAVALQPPKSEKQEKPKAEQPKKQEKKKEVAADDEEEEDKPAPKPKHPLDALARATFVLDDW